MAGPRISRRTFLQGVGAVAGGTTFGLPNLPLLGRPGRRVGPAAVPLTLRVNGADRRVDVEPRVTLLNALRDHLDITGPKKICDRGACGGCTVLLGGRPVPSCMVLAVDAEGAEIVTVEGLAGDERLSPLQQAFVECDAMQCGFCTAGFVTTAKALLDRTPHPTDGEIRAALAGNLCRCGTYPRVFEAVRRAAGR